MTWSRFTIALVVTLSAMLHGCGPRVEVVRQSAGGELRGSRLVLVPVDFEGMRVRLGSEDDYMATLAPDDRRRWPQTRMAFALAYADRLLRDPNHPPLESSAAPPPGTYRVRPRVLYLEPGVITGSGLYDRPTEVRLLVSILKPDGSLLDEIRITSKARPAPNLPDDGARLIACAGELAAITATFLAERAGE